VTAIVPLDDRVLLADATARCLRSYSTEGVHQRDIGHDGRMKGFLIPNGVLDFSVDSEGIIHAANPGKHRVERYTLEGKLLGHIGRFDGRDPAGFSGCCNPTNVTVHGDQIYVTEKAAPRAKVYDREGGLVAVIASEVFDPLCKNMDLAVDSRGRVFVIDTARLCIRVFANEEAEEEDD
jgi:sugar lactone lactonase YvrE